MKNTLLALTTSLLLAAAAAPTVSAQDAYYYNRDGVYIDGDVDRDGIPNRFDRYDNRYDRYDSYGNRLRFEVGGYLPVGFYDDSSHYINYRVFGLDPPPYGYRWTRVDDDVYLVSTRDGLIAEVVYNLLR
jgi:Ni/Co efflux regulator RcnB